MKQINKKDSPKEFEGWKHEFRTGDGQSIVQLYNSKNATGSKLWDLLPSTPLVGVKSDLNYSKQDLRAEVLSEQAYICCYCNQAIQESTTILEHFIPKGSSPELTFEYTNLLASCTGGQKDPKPRFLHCDAGRKEGEKLELSPLHADCEQHFACTIDGQIIGTTDKGKDMIVKLGLSVEKLRKLREAYIKNHLYENPFATDKKPIDQTEANQRIARLKEMNTGKFEPFCTLIINVLTREIIQAK